MGRNIFPEYSRNKLNRPQLSYVKEILYAFILCKSLLIDVTTTFAVFSQKKETYRIMIADKIKNARTILYYITIIIVGIICTYKERII